MDPFRLFGGLVMILGGLYAVWLCIYRWDVMLAEDPSVQRLAHIWGKRLAQVICVGISLMFAALGLGLLFGFNIGIFGEQP